MTSLLSPPGVQAGGGASFSPQRVPKLTFRLDALPDRSRDEITFKELTDSSLAGALSVLESVGVAEIRDGEEPLAAMDRDRDAIRDVSGLRPGGRYLALPAFGGKPLRGKARCPAARLSRLPPPVSRSAGARKEAAVSVRRGRLPASPVS